MNAADNFQRGEAMTKIEVSIDKEKISVWNNGKGIPCIVHQKLGVYIGEVIFGQLLTSSNYDDSEMKSVGGRNGYGAKLANIFSKLFLVEAADSVAKKVFCQTFRDNMTKRDEPIIKAYKEKEDYTLVTFYPDTKKFEMEALDEDTIKVLSKRVYDIAGLLPTVQVFLNGRLIDISGFESYIDLYLPKPKIYAKINERWEVGITISEGQFRQVSFVNAICTSKGGTHVNHITEQIVNYLQGIIKKKYKMKLKGYQIKCYLWVFVNAMVINPAFDSQSKETLITRADSFGDIVLPESLLKELVECGIIEALVAAAKAKERANFIKQLKAKNPKGCTKLIGVDKLEDANWAGTKRSNECTLILTEGDSAKALAMAGIEVVGRDKYGVFPLRGKLLNARDAPYNQIKNNIEIQNIIKIMGLTMGVNYEDTKNLRYGRIMIMADQDYDGSHIKGLILNFIHTFWPSLLKIQGFICQFITPIIRVTKKKEVKSFFTISDYEQWVKDKNLKEYKIKYYKGLGTSTVKEAKEYFQAIDMHSIDFRYLDEEDDNAILMAFSKNKAQQRKEWILNYNHNACFNYSSRVLSYQEFINKELILFSLYDNKRSIPSLCDGLKPSQRKVLYACFKRKLHSEIKIAQLAGYVAEHSCYHHGEVSLIQTIISMAQNFTGSNNINLLLPIGQFGTRYANGKDAGSGRYIYTKLSKLTRYIYREEDDELLNYLIDEGQQVEPQYYLPVIPMILVNGCTGIGTGWSSFIPNYNPRELVDCLKLKMRNKAINEILPWYKNYKGMIVKDEGKLICYGKAKVLKDNKLEITEISIKKSIGEYKGFLETLIEVNKKSQSKRGSWTRPHEKLISENKVYSVDKQKKGNKENMEVNCEEVQKEFRINDFKEYHKGNHIKFVLELNDKQMEVFELKLQKESGDYKLMKELKLTNAISTTDFVCFDAKGNLKRYESVKKIIDEYYDARLELYKKRKEHQVKRLNEELQMVNNKIRFINEIMAGKLIIFRKKKTELVDLLKAQGYKAQKQNSKSKLIAQVEGLKEYEYLLSISIFTFTEEKLTELEMQKEEKEKKLKELMNCNELQLWEKDLDEFITALNKLEEQEKEQERKMYGDIDVEEEPMDNVKVQQRDIDEVSETILKPIN